MFPLSTQLVGIFILPTGKQTEPLDPIYLFYLVTVTKDIISKTFAFSAI